MGMKMIPHPLFISLVVCYLIVPWTLSSQSNIAYHQDHNVGVSDLLDLIKTEFVKQNHRIALLEIQNKNQDEDIDMLKVDNSKIHDKLDLVNGKTIYEVLSNNDAEPSNSNYDSTSDILIKKQFQQRASRLIPTSLLFNNEKEVVPTVPFNCKDLNKMGHTVNGIYLVNGGKTIGKPRIKIVLCDFHPPITKKSSSLSAVVEEKMGFVNLKPNNLAAPEGIYFYVQRTHGPSIKDGVIRFHKEHLNVGKGMNMSTGVFTVPKAGIYQFTFAISKEALSFQPLHVYLRVNKGKIGVAIVGTGPVAAPATFQSALKLKKGDRVDVWKPNSGTIGECIVLGGDAVEPPCHHFTGWLLEEDI